MNSKFTTIIRRLLGLLLIIFGSNMFWHFIPLSNPAGPASKFLNLLNGIAFIFPVVGALEIVVGIMLLLKKWDAFALILMAPVTINILLFHLFLDIPGREMAILVAVLNGILIYKNRKAYSPLFIR